MLSPGAQEMRLAKADLDLIAAEAAAATKTAQYVTDMIAVANNVEAGQAARRRLASSIVLYCSVF